jgi:hypothetical protein
VRRESNRPVAGAEQGALSQTTSSERVDRRSAWLRALSAAFQRTFSGSS